MSGLATIIGVLGAGMGGYAKGKADYNREQELAAQRAEEGELRAERKRLREEDAAIREASKVAPVQEAKPFDGVGPAAFMGAGKNYGTQEQALEGANDAAMVNRIGALNQYGRTGEALTAANTLTDLQTKRRAAADKLKQEGAIDFIEANFANAPSVADIKAGKVGAFDLSGLDTYNKTGNHTLPAGTRGQWKVLDLGNGREVADFVAVGADGKPISTMTGRTMLAIHGMSLKEREALEDSRFRDSRDFRLKKGLTDAQIAHYRDRGDAAITRANGAGGGSGGGKGGGGGSAYERMSEFERKQYEAAHRDLLDLQGKLRGAKAGADYSPESRGIRDLEEESALLRDQILRLEKKYSGDEPGKPKSDLDLTRPGSDAPPPKPGAPAVKPKPAAPTPAKPVASPAAQGVGMSGANLKPTQDATLNGIQSDNIKVLDGLKVQVAQAESQMAAAAKSGDPKALQAYATRLTQARAALATEAERRLGNNAPVYLAQR